MANNVNKPKMTFAEIMRQFKQAEGKQKLGAIFCFGAAIVMAVVSIVLLF